MERCRTTCACAAPQPATGAIACARCGGPLGFDYDLTQMQADAAQGASMWRYWRRLPVPDPACVVSLGEGGTPLLASALTAAVALTWKDETRNPTGSHKDRALSLSVSFARLHGARVSAVVSAGSTGLANAAYAARAGLRSVTLVPAGTPQERLFPLAVYGSRLIEVDAGIDAAIAALRVLHGQSGIAVASTERRSNPVQAEAAKTIAYEIVAELGDAPDWVLVPTGGGGTVAGLWRGFLEARALREATRLPRLAAIVPDSHDALAAALRAGIATPEDFADLHYEDGPPTLLAKLAHAHPPDGLEALEAIRGSGGAVVAVGEQDAVAGTHQIAAADGLYLEPSSGVLAPALEILLAARTIAPGARVVGLACGSGYRESFAMAARETVRLERVALAELAAALI
jgi:threonine synthase